MFRSADEQSDVRWLPVKNDSGEEVPGYGVMVVTGYDDETGCFTIDKPNTDGTSPGMLLVNGPGIIAADEYGFGTRDFPVLAKTTGTAGAEVGTEADSWSLATAKKGFLLWSDSTDGLAVVNTAIVSKLPDDADIDCADGTLSTGSTLEIQATVLVGGVCCTRTTTVYFPADVKVCVGPDVCP